MKNISKIFAAVALGTAMLTSGPAVAGPIERSCQLLAAIGSNNAAAIESSLKDATRHWPDANRSDLINRLKELVGALKFVGGTVYRTAKLGDDIEEHLLVLRLAKGEVAGMRIRYEWGPTGMLLITINFDRKYHNYVKEPFLQTPVKIGCP